MCLPSLSIRVALASRIIIFKLIFILLNAWMKNKIKRIFFVVKFSLLEIFALLQRVLCAGDNLLEDSLTCKLQKILSRCLNGTLTTLFFSLDQRDYICEYCARAFKSSHNLAVHRMIHTGEKPLQ